MVRRPVKFQKVLTDHTMLFQVMRDHKPSKWPDGIAEAPVSKRRPEFPADVVLAVSSAFRNNGFDAAVAVFHGYYPILNLRTSEDIVCRCFEGGLYHMLYADAMPKDRRKRM